MPRLVRRAGLSLQDEVARRVDVRVRLDLEVGLLVAVDVDLDEAACAARVGPNLSVPTGENARPAEGEGLARAVREIVQIDLVPAEAEIIDDVVILTDPGVAQCREQEG